MLGGGSSQPGIDPGTPQRQCGVFPLYHCELLKVGSEVRHFKRCGDQVTTLCGMRQEEVEVWLGPSVPAVPRARGDDRKNEESRGEPLGVRKAVVRPLLGAVYS